MKKQYTKKQIQEAISYWEKQLKRMDEGLLGGNRSVYKFIKILKRELDSGKDPILSIAGKNGETYAVHHFNFIDATGDVYFQAENGDPLYLDEFRQKLSEWYGRKIEDIRGIYVWIPNSDIDFGLPL